MVHIKIMGQHWGSSSTIILEVAIDGVVSGFLPYTPRRVNCSLVWQCCNQGSHNQECPGFIFYPIAFVLQQPPAFAPTSTIFVLRQPTVFAPTSSFCFYGRWWRLYFLEMMMIILLRSSLRPTSWKAFWMTRLLKSFGMCSNVSKAVKPLWFNVILAPIFTPDIESKYFTVCNFMG